MYLRFILPGKDPASGVGLAEAAQALQSRDDIPAETRSELAGLLAWMDAELTRPSGEGIAWIKDTALEPVERLQRLVQILRDNGQHVAMIRSANPGSIVYEDDHQIVAEPFNDMLQRV